MSYKFQVGKTYLTQRGEAVRVILRHAELRGYETVMGEDGKHRYDRSNDHGDAGRCTGTAHDYSDPDNFERPPLEVRWVPVEPTQDMLYAMAECDGYQRGDRDHPMLTQWEDYWRMALSAAPDPCGVLVGAPPNCGACPGDRSICPQTCRVADESPPIPKERWITCHNCGKPFNAALGMEHACGVLAVDGSKAE